MTGDNRTKPAIEWVAARGCLQQSLAPIDPWRFTMAVVSEAVRGKLVAAAREAARRAHCPYSCFHVGAALLANGQIVSGCNIENASYGLTICAERVAVFSAIASGLGNFEMLAVSCIDAGNDDPPESRMPCGACRQVLAEFCDPEMPIIVDGVGAFSLREILPIAFQLQKRSTNSGT
jgi:cytidine deaminase